MAHTSHICGNCGGTTITSNSGPAPDFCPHCGVVFFGQGETLYTIDGKDINTLPSEERDRLLSAQVPGPNFVD